MKKKSYPTSLYLDPDVRCMVVSAKARGMKFQYLCNEALRVYLPKLGFNVRKAK